MKSKLVLYGTGCLCFLLIILGIVLFINSRNKKSYDNFATRDKEFQIDTEEVKASRGLKDVVKDNEDYVISNGLTYDLVVNSSWEYNTVDDVYISNVYSDGFHAVIISVTNNTIIIDPE